MPLASVLFHTILILKLKEDIPELQKSVLFRIVPFGPVANPVASGMLALAETANYSRGRLP
jgi:hypothetical protein